MSRVLHIRFWLPLWLVAGTIPLALLACATVALSGTLFAVIAQPETF
jgi:hypothetical protein